MAVYSRLIAGFEKVVHRMNRKSGRSGVTEKAAFTADVSKKQG